MRISLAVLTVIAAIAAHTVRADTFDDMGTGASFAPQNMLNPSNPYYGHLLYEDKKQSLEEIVTACDKAGDRSAACATARSEFASQQARLVSDAAYKEARALIQASSGEQEALMLCTQEYDKSICAKALSDYKHDRKNVVLFAGFLVGVVVCVGTLYARYRHEV